jgi:hypothetical protein
MLFARDLAVEIMNDFENWLAQTDVATVAPDNFVRKSSRTLTLPEKWLLLGKSDRFLWGEFEKNKERVLQTAVDSQTWSLYCTCSSRKFPCIHALALLRMAQEQPEKFDDTRPEWVAALPKLPLPGQYQAGSWRHNPARANEVVRGMASLDLWLRDLIRGGLAAAKARPKPYWQQIKNRLVDAHAPATAEKLSQMAALPRDHLAWASDLLKEAGQLFLLAQGFARLERLPLAVQGDLFTAVGWPVPDVLETAVPIRDQWFVLGKQSGSRKNRQEDIFWLWGQAAKRPAYIVVQRRANKPVGRVLVAGTTLDVALIFYASQTPLRAGLVDVHEERSLGGFPSGYTSLTEGVDAAAQALAANPWLAQWPMPLAAAWVQKVGADWVVMDEDGGMLPLPAKFKRGWHLLALSGGRPFPLFGVWDGKTFTPLTVWLNGRLLDIYTLPEVA